MNLAALLKRCAGQAAEDAVARELRRRGWEIIARNARCKVGEIDLVARDGPTVVIVEVRSRRLGAPVSPRETITAAKQQRLRRLAEAFLRERGWSGKPVRIDVAEVLHTAEGQIRSIDLMPAAVDGGHWRR